MRSRFGRRMGTSSGSRDFGEAHDGEDDHPSLGQHSLRISTPPSKRTARPSSPPHPRHAMTARSSSCVLADVKTRTTADRESTISRSRMKRPIPHGRQDNGSDDCGEREVHCDDHYTLREVELDMCKGFCLHSRYRGHTQVGLPT